MQLKPPPGFPRFALRYERALLAAGRVHVYVGAGAAMAHRAGMGHALAMNAEREMQGRRFRARTDHLCGDDMHHLVVSVRRFG
jgi:hypothetical protein